MPRTRMRVGQLPNLDYMPDCEWDCAQTYAAYQTEGELAVKPRIHARL
jgi:hypothetical protein